VSLLWALALLIALPAGLFSLVFGAMALAAIPLSLILVLLMPRRWREGLAPATLFMSAMLLSPVVLMSTLAVAALIEKPIEWQSFEWRQIEHARLPGETWRHLFPVRPPRAATPNPDPAPEG
jgi:hypothetical protein